MKFNLVAVLLSLFALGLSHQDTSADDKSHGIQLVSPKDKTFVLNGAALSSILNNDDLEDRHLVIISIAGPFRQGKSFLLNFFIRYLNAQYKKHDASNWLGGDGPLEGFKWRSGQKRETTGIWVWSDFFTHDYEDGRKVAIILMDTQGVFDHQTSTQDNILIFALSIMSSSVQCYNLMQNIKEDNLQHLRLFSEYGRISLNHTSEKSFQKLLFIVRDWPFAHETGYGWNGTKTVENIMKITEDQSDENTALRKQLRQSFNEIDGFLMPSPGEIATKSGSFTGDLNEIDPNFKTYVKILVEELLSPEKLIVKKIGGQELTIQDWVRYLQSSMEMFKGDQLPKPKDMFQMTLEASQKKLFSDSLANYVKKMTKALNRSEQPQSDGDFIATHQMAKDETFEEFDKVPKFGDETSISVLHGEIEKAIEKKSNHFVKENDMKHAAHNKNITEYNRLLANQIEYRVRDKFLKEFELKPELTTFVARFHLAKFGALQEFDHKMMGASENAQGLRNRLERHLSELEHALSEAIIHKLAKVAKDAKDAQDAQQNAINAQIESNATGEHPNPVALLTILLKLGCLFITSIVC
ncbi:atlastin-like [Sitodiplosis mosellana]|uniref:atlastin-like n=1 Tax=Sitodiplosis mosellana TaxID=263140 RepID=UPI002444E1C2|nr:atlastin-like [Sitodiplosis mosellana]